jgi:hypothetical protein
VNDWYDRVFELIDTRSFSNMWFWIALAVTWSGASHWILGVPYDLVQRARRRGGAVEEDLHDLVRVNVNRLLDIADRAGMWIAGLVGFSLSTLLIVGFGYGLEFAQALFLLALPLSLVFGLSIRTARALRAADGAGLYRRMARHRLWVQVIGMISIFVTALWGMFQNMSIGVI